MRARGLLTILSVVSACRGNFQQELDAAPAPPDAPPPQLSCDPKRFSAAGMVSPAAALQDPALVNQIAVAPTPRGYHVFFVDAVNALHGVSFELVGNDLVETARTAAPILTDVSGAIGAVALPPDTADNAEVLLAVPCSSTSTALISLDSKLQRASDGAAAFTDAIHDGWMGGRGSLVRADGNRLLFLAMKDGTSELYAKRVSRAGVDQDGGTPRQVSTGGFAPSGQRIVPAGSGYMVLWDAAGQTPNEVQATMLDGQLGVTTPPTKISPDITETMSDSDLPAAAYSEASRVSLFTWVIKVSRDQLWFSLRDEQLQKTSPVAMTPEGNEPQIVAGDDDFLVVWTDAGGSQQLSAARIGTDGSFIRPGLSTTGGRAPAWDVVVRDGQPALVWFEEITGGESYLWFNALCRPD